MERDIDKSSLVTQVNGTRPCYKRWLGSDSLLLMSLCAENSNYDAHMLNFVTGESCRWEPGAACGIWAQDLPASMLDKQGNVIRRDTIYTRPRLYMSGDRSHLCWMDSEQCWIVCDVQSGSFRRQHRLHLRAEDRQAVWLADNLTYAEPVRMSDGKRVVRFIVYSGTEDVVTILRVPRARSGICLGTTASNEIVTLAHSGSGIPQFELSHVTLSIIALRDGAIRSNEFDVALPVGWMLLEAGLCGAQSRLAWLLASDADPKQYTIWISDLRGQSLALLGYVDGLPELSNVTTDRAYDLEWTPDGSSVSFVWKNGVYVLPAVVASEVEPQRHGHETQ